jgi:hypothetical protein
MFIKKIFFAFLSLGCSLSAMSQLPMESAVQISLTHAPRSAAKASTQTLSNSSLIAEMGLSGGGIICVGDAQDRTAAWIFKHRLPSPVKGEAALETDLSEKLRMEVLGYSEVGVVKAPSPTTPARDVVLGQITSTQTVVLTFEPRAGFSNAFWGSLVVKYTVTQEAGRFEASWVPSGMSMRLVGWSVPYEDGPARSASLTVTMGAFKRIIASKAASAFGSDGFSTGIDPVLWPVRVTNHGSMTITGFNGRVSFPVLSRSTGENNAYMVWAGRPTAQTDWSMEVTGHNSFNAPKGSASFQFFVSDARGLSGNRISDNSRAFSLEFTREGGTVASAMFEHWIGDNKTHSAWAPSSTTDFQLRVVYRANLKQFESWYDDSGAGTNWKLLRTLPLLELVPDATPSTQFIVGMVVHSTYGPIPVEQVWADDFRVMNSL